MIKVFLSFLFLMIFIPTISATEVTDREGRFQYGLNECVTNKFALSILSIKTDMPNPEFAIFAYGFERLASDALADCKAIILPAAPTSLHPLRRSQWLSDYEIKWRDFAHEQSIIWFSKNKKLIKHQIDQRNKDRIKK